jgi:ElaB/YqjD/DUF883 family membrane-anchored ribosome-binding protein
MSTTSDQLGKQAMAVKKDLEEMGETVRDAAQEKVGQVRENVSQYYAQGHDAVHDLACSAKDFFRERPLQSVLIAAGIGWLFGRLGKRG